MCSSCAVGKEGHSAASARRQRLNVFVAVLLVAAGGASGAFGLVSLLGQGAGRAAAAPRSAGTLELRGHDLRSGRSLSSALRRHAVIVEFWSSACPGCRQVAQNLQRLAPPDRSIALVGVDVGDTVARARMLARRLGWRYLSGADPGARLAKTVGLRTLPTTLLLDRQHRVVLRAVGPRSLQTLDNRFEQLPSRKPPRSR